MTRGVHFEMVGVPHPQPKLVQPCGDPTFIKASGTNSPDDTGGLDERCLAKGSEAPL